MSGTAAAQWRARWSGCPVARPVERPPGGAPARWRATIGPMKDTLTIGLENTTTHVVTADGSAPHLSVPVLATPAMIGMIEYCCMEATRPYMEGGETTVGAHVCVSHERPTYVGQEYRIHAVLARIDGRRLTFEVTVENDAGRVSTGTHERGVVDFSRFG